MVRYSRRTRYRPRRSYRSRRRTYRRNYRRRSNPDKINFLTKRIGAGFPDQLVTRLRYSESFQINPPSGGLMGTYVFRCNNCYDPNYTGTGHQPMGWDTFADVYTSYIVTGSKITARFGTYEDSLYIPMVVGIKTNDASSLSMSSVNGMIEQGSNNNRYKIVNSRGIYAGNSIPKVTAYWSGKKWFGWSNAGDNIAAFGAPTDSSGPTQQCYFIVYAQDTTGAQDIGPINCVVTIDYVVRFSDPREGVQS